VPLKGNFSWLAMTIGLTMSLILMWFSPLNPSAPATIPLLMALLMAELGFLVNAAGVYTALAGWRKNGDRRSMIIALGNSLLAINLAYSGFVLWTRTGGL
jgi:hypothetical protein